MKHKFSLILIISALLCSTLAWSANLITPGTYSGKWTQHSISQLDGYVKTATSVIVWDEEDGKQIITFKGYKVGYDGDVATDIKIEVNTSNGSCTIAKDTETGHTHATYGTMYIRTYANYTSSINPQSMIITLCAHYYYYKPGTTTELLPGNNKYEYIQLNPIGWTEWIDFPEEGNNTATWTFNTNNAFSSLIDPSCQVTLQSRQSVSNPLLKQILVKGFKMKASSADCIETDLVFNWDTETNLITLAYSGLGFYEATTAKQARGRMTSTGKFDFETGKFTLPMEYVYANTWKSAVQETLQLQDFESMYSDWTDFKPLGLAKGNYRNNYKNADHNDLSISERHPAFAENLKQIRVLDWNYSTSDAGKTNLIIDWNSETNVCTIPQQSTKYTTNSKTIYVLTRSNGSYNSETATFSFPIKYATTETVLSSDKTDVLQMQKAVTSISFANESYTLAKGYTRIITPTVTPADATNKSVTYTSSNTDVATVDNGENAGKIHFKSVGQTIITATANDGSGVSGSYKLTTFVRVTGITLNKESVDLSPNSEVTLTATVAPDNATAQTVNWSSDNEEVVTVDENGKLQFVGIGSATITASANDDSGKSSSCEVSTYRISLANPEYGTEYVVPVNGGKAYFKDAPSSSQLQFVLEGKDYVQEDWTVSGTNLNWITLSRGYSTESHKVLFSFSASDSSLTPRAGSFSIKAFDYEFAYTISQAAPTLTPRIGTDNQQTFTFLAAGDDTLQINGAKKAKIYLDSEINLSNNDIQVVSKQGLTKIDKGYGANFIRLTLTRKQFVPEEAKDTVVVYFKNNPSIEYKYYITQAGCGKLTTNHDYRTFVVGPKGGNALAVDENDEITYANSVRVYANIPTKDNVKGGWYSTTHICNFEMSNKQDDKGYYKLILPIEIEGENNTGVDRLDSFRVYLPGCDTIKFYVRQETTPRVWQYRADRDTALEVNNKGGKARFKGYTITEMTLVSNTPIEENEVNVTCAGWITPNSVINANKDTVRITFTVGEYAGNESRTDKMTITVQGNEFIMPLTQKVFSVEWNNGNNDEELVVPVAGGTATWKGSEVTELQVNGTEAYRDGLLQVTVPDGVAFTRKTGMLNTGRQRTTFTFSKTGTVTEDWSGEITISLDSTNTEGFDYHFSKTFTITQPAAKMWYDDSQSDELSFAAEGEDSEDIKVWANFPFSYTGITYFATNNTGWFSIHRRQDNAVKDGDNYYYLFYIKTKANTEEERNGSVYVALKNKTEIKTTTLSFIQVPAPYTRTVTNGNWGTICLPYAATSFFGAEMYSIAGKMENDKGIYLDQVNEMEAGVPYIFKATAEEIKVVYAAGEAQEAQTVNGLCGYIGKEDLTVPTDGNSYIVYQNALYLVDSEGVTIASNRAYIHYDNELGTPSTAPQIRRVAMPINGAPANILQVNDTKQPVKILRDGHIVILRDNKEYNILGQSK